MEGMNCNHRNFQSGLLMWSQGWWKMSITCDCVVPVIKAPLKVELWKFTWVISICNSHVTFVPIITILRIECWIGWTTKRTMSELWNTSVSTPSPKSACWTVPTFLGYSLDFPSRLLIQQLPSWFGCFGSSFTQQAIAIHAGQPISLWRNEEPR